MFCPKCGLQNADETKFCRGCGADLGNLMAVVEGKKPGKRELSEKHIELYSSGIRGVMIGSGFMIVSAVAFMISLCLAPMFLFFMVFAFYFLGTGVSRLIHARALKALNEPDDDRRPRSLSPGQPDYIKPLQSIYNTDDLVARPFSVTEHTTTHLEMEPDGETVTVQKKFRRDE